MTKRLIFSFLFPYVLAIIFVCFFPGRSMVENYYFLFFSSWIFVVIVLLLGLVTYGCLLQYKKGQSISCDCIVDAKWVGINSWFLFFLPLLGVFFLFYDRVVIRNINYLDQELRAARYEWLSSEGGSFFGIAGNLFIPFSYVGVFFALRYFKYIKIRYLLLCTSVFSIFFHAYLNGGRSNVFLLLVFLVVLYCIGRYKINIALILNKFSFLAVLFLLAVFFYILAVVKSSASIGGASIQELLYFGLIEMYGVPDLDFFKEDHSDLLCFLLYSFLYLFHGQWTSQIVYSLDERAGYHSIVSAFTVILDDLGVIDLGLYERAFSDTGAFVSLPASVYYDFGWLGLVVYSTFFGWLFGVVLFYVNTYRRLGLVGAGLVFFTMPILILSPIVPAYGFSYYSFILFAFFVFFITNMAFFRRKIYL